MIIHELYLVSSKYHVTQFLDTYGFGEFNITKGRTTVEFSDRKIVIQSCAHDDVNMIRGLNVKHFIFHFTPSDDFFKEAQYRAFRNKGSITILGKRVIDYGQNN